MSAEHNAKSVSAWSYLVRYHLTMDISTVIYGLIFLVVNPWAFIELRRTTSARKERVKRPSPSKTGKESNQSPRSHD
jgi:hypothetical protein